MLTPKVPSGSPVQVYFVELQLKQNGTLLDRNVYWLSTSPTRSTGARRWASRRA